MKMSRRFKVPRHGRFTLADHDPDATPGLKNKAEGEKELARNLERIEELQYDLYAENRQSLLIVLQALDCGGKDGLIRQLAVAFNPQGCRVTSFKVPSAEEAQHDFLWRIHRAAPRRGEVGIFNRSQYEDVLVVRVHELVPEREWKERYEQINAFERELHAGGTRILKFYLNISKDEQKRRLEERLENPRKHWKFSEGDLAERKKWRDYMAAYEDALHRCSTPWAPWYVIPADHKWYRNAAVSQIVRETLEDMKPQIPSVQLPKRIRIT